LATFAADKNRRAIEVDQQPVTQPVDLYEAMARALKYNLDHKIEITEVALRYAELRSGEFDMLPELVARVDWSDRSNQPFARSLEKDGTVDPDASTSTDIGSVSSDLKFSWDILDFGLSYYRSKQAADTYLIAEEQRRSTINRVIEDVRTAFWRAVAAERHLGEIDNLEMDARRALSDAEEQVRNGNGDKLEALRYQREMLETLRSAQEVRRDLFVAKNQLAALMNLPQGQTFSLSAVGQHDLTTPITALSSEQMTEMALRNRPEMREIAYRLRINESEEDAAVLSLLPSIRGYLGINYDTNDYLVNANWTEWGARVSWDLINLARYPRKKERIAKQEALLEARALALTQAIATQVYVSNKRFQSLRQETRVARELHSVSDRVFTQARKEYDSGVGSGRDLVRERLNAILASLRYFATYAEMQGAFANVYAAVGLDAFDGALTGNENLEELAASLRSLWRKRGDKASVESPEPTTSPRANRGRGRTEYWVYVPQKTL
jgi:outer membrane protein TolC